MPQVFGKVGRAQPTTVVSDTAQVQQRVTGYGDLITTQLGDNHSALADEGSYFKAVSTPATAIAGGVYSTFVATTPLISITNNGTVGGKRIFIDYIRLITTAIGTGPVNTQCAVVIDTATRTYSGGTNFTPVNVNSDSSTASICGATGFRFGAVTTSAVGSPRLIARHNFKIASAPVIGDMYSMDFGEHMSGAASLTGTTATVFPASVGPVAIGGGHSFYFYLWHTTISAAPSFEFEIAWWER